MPDHGNKEPSIDTAVSVVTENPFEATPSGAPVDYRQHWSVFRAFNYYRLIFIIALAIAFFVDQSKTILGVVDETLFKTTAFIYFGLVILALIANFLRKPGLIIQMQIQVLIDIIILSLLALASGGLGSILLPFILVAVAVSAILLPIQAIIITCIITGCALFGILVYHSILSLDYPLTASADSILGLLTLLPSALIEQATELVKIGILTGVIAIAAVITHKIATRTRRSEDLAHQRSVELLDLARLNSAIVQHLQSGIVVVNRFAQITLMNQTARELLNFPEPLQTPPLAMVSPALAQRLSTWVSTGLNNARPFRQADHLPDISPIFSHLTDKPQATETLIFLEDTSHIEQRVQRVKLAALGRLTASIAHEIRNPLASIDHAAQLLQESTIASSNDQRLGHIIHENAQRASRIISNVLDLSRRERAKPEDIRIKSWLEEFCKEFLRNHSSSRPRIELRVRPNNLIVRFDTVHLHQVLWNLLTNACLHGTPDDAQPPQIKVFVNADSGQHRSTLDVIDFGPGIDEAEQKKIFEPFFTTRSKGTGLGLYIAREICEANRGQLQYLRNDEGGSCFRLTFASSSSKAQVHLSE